MKSRMKNPVMLIPEAMQALLALKAAAEKGGVPAATLALVSYAPARSTAAASAWMAMRA